ncbi:MAG: Flp pilus assembly complex ATPase component TadA [Deltaproteobacteria bacterium]|jgi:defect-in-organelle-trafficking protein DotB|nr:Flp pilus assembly complex ATPase component TadA [Deltaproteobacteria bacterium]
MSDLERKDSIWEAFQTVLSDEGEKAPPSLSLAAGRGSEGLQSPSILAPIYPENGWGFEDFERLLIFLKEKGMSDAVISSMSPAAARLDGVWYRVTEHLFSNSEVAEILNQASANEAASSIALSGIEQDFSFEIAKRRETRLRFRGNAIAKNCLWGTGLALTLRLIPTIPPSLEDLEVPEDLLEALFPSNGLVLVTGTMGSGKSTFLAAALRDLAQRGGKHICTYESPVEFDLASVPGVNPPLEQSEIPRHVESFLKATRNLTRRAADVVLVGESRDPETLQGVLEAAEMGLAAYTTVHTRSVADTPTRILNVFGPKERRMVAATLFSSLRLIVQQRLFPRLSGGRKAVREYLVLDPDLREKLCETELREIPLKLENMVREYGVPLLAALEKEVKNGEIHPLYLKSVIREKGRL